MRNTFNQVCKGLLLFEGNQATHASTFIALDACYGAYDRPRMLDGGAAATKSAVDTGGRDSFTYGLRSVWLVSTG